MYNIYNTSVFYVSPSTGNNRLNGMLPVADGYGNGPFQTLERAFRAVSDLRVTGVKRPITIALTEDYYLNAPIVIPADINAVTLESYGTRRRLIGGIRIDGWKHDTFNGVPCLSAVLPPKHDGTRWDVTDLFVNGKRADATRYPKEGTLRALDTETNSRVLFAPSKWFIADKKDLEQVEGITDAIVNFYHWWVDEHTPVESYDPDTGKLTMAYQSRFSINTIYEASETAALYYFLTNVPTMFSAPNEWYLVRDTGTVYYIPEDPSADPASIDAYVPVTSQLFQIESADICIRDLELMCTRGEYESKMDYVDETSEYSYNPNAAYASDIQSVCWAPGAISYRNAVRCSIFDCDLHNLGVHGIAIGTGCHHIRIERNRIEDICAGGIKIYGGEYGKAPEYKTDNCIIRGNTITRCGRRYAAGCGILVNHASDVEISENEISYLDYTGVSVGWVWGYAPSSTYGCVIRGNHIHHIGLGKLSDMGGIYLLGKQQGTVVSENRIHDVLSTHYGGWGIYTDEGSSYITIENNVVFNTKTECFHQHYGSYNVVRNNIFAFGSACARVSREELHDGVLFTNNIFVVRNTPVYGEETSIHTMTASHNFIWDVNGKEICMMRTRDGAAYDLDAWKNQCGKDIGSIVCDPFFADAENYDFTISADSFAVQNGFKPLTGFLASGKR